MTANNQHAMFMYNFVLDLLWDELTFDTVLTSQLCIFRLQVIWVSVPSLGSFKALEKRFFSFDIDVTAPLKPKKT